MKKEHYYAVAIIANGLGTLWFAFWLFRDGHEIPKWMHFPIGMTAILWVVIVTGILAATMTKDLDV